MKNNLRIGFGYDVHRLIDGDGVVLGGIHIPFNKALLGHSDADVLLHAICDALLGAAGLGDIGQHFPDTDPVYKGRDSSFFLETVSKMIGNAGWTVINLDATLLAEQPRISPFRLSMQQHIATVLQMDAGCVNIKATTTEGLGPFGRGEGIAAQCAALLETRKVENNG